MLLNFSGRKKTVKLGAYAYGCITVWGKVNSKQRIFKLKVNLGNPLIWKIQQGWKCYYLIDCLKLFGKLMVHLYVISVNTSAKVSKVIYSVSSTYKK